MISPENEEHARLFHELYTRGMTTEDISTACGRLHGHHCIRQQVSHLSTRRRDDVEAWLSRDFSAHDPVVYIDATYVPTRRSTADDLPDELDRASEPELQARAEDAGLDALPAGRALPAGLGSLREDKYNLCPKAGTVRKLEY